MLPSIFFTTQDLRPHISPPLPCPLFGIPKLAGFVDLLAGKADIASGGQRKTVLLGNGFGSAIGRNLTPLLRGIILIRKAALGSGLDLGSVSHLIETVGGCVSLASVTRSLTGENEVKILGNL